MKQNDAIGGYFELEIQKNNTELHETAIAVNSARTAFEYILKVRKPKLVHMPKFTCEVMLAPLEKLNIEYQFYYLNRDMEIVGDINVENDELLVYTNYFGCKDRYSKQLANIFGEKLIIDCSQAFYYQRYKNEHVIYSPRKFFGVTDGGYVITDQLLDEEIPAGVSYQRMGHLLKRADIGAEAGYQDFKTNDASLEGEALTSMSNLTRKLLGSVDYEAARMVRRDNFKFLHNNLVSDNLLSIDINNIDCPMVYPFLVEDSQDIKNRLIENKIFVATYWPNVFEWCDEDDVEYYLAKNIIALPIDQRYDRDDMQRILEVINNGN